MMNVLLVDDEPWVLEGLRTIVNWNKHGFQICGEAANGHSAWSLMERLQPDLVLTDIHMPSISGLELINRSHQELSHPPRFVILSGYDNFEYAKTALEQQVEDYLLKPIDEDEIELVLEQVKRTILHEQAATERWLLDRNLYGKGLIHRLLQGEDHQELVYEAADWLQIESYEKVACLLIDANIGEREWNQLVKERIQSFLPERCAYLEGRGVLLAGERSYALDQLEALGRSIVDEGSDDFIVMMAAGYGEGGVLALRTAYQQALSTLERKINDRRGGTANLNGGEQNDKMRSVNKNALAALMNILCSNDHSKLEPAMDALLAEPSSRRPASDMEYIRIQLLALEMEILKQLKAWGGNAEHFAERLQPGLSVFIERLNHAEIRRYTADLCRRSMEVLGEQRQRSEANTIFQVVRYVDQEFRTKLQLQDLARRFHMNSNYMGQAFKQQTGRTFREYLNDRRVEEAKRLLRQTRMSIAEVAAHSGYPNADYFVSQFKRMTGAAPSVYRKQQ
ncbi:response regulator transcription factor [Paenibacillus sanguinis]|uniref:response regulator transcription factor n=1 Tax=Paenibacillus sanguinis TaxID=225906 RepID=UPI00035F59E6|nr:helix-turn-helix domain-containing protein [Paenibacillus sanguinis]